MAGGGGGEVLPVSPRADQPAAKKRQRAQAAACLPLDVIAEIAERSDAATLVRCAATCRGARRRIAGDPNLRGCLRLRDTGRFLLPLLRGHLARITIDDEGGRRKSTVYLVDTTTAADATRVVEATFASAAAEAEALSNLEPMDSRGGLVLIGATATAPPLRGRKLLLVCNPATGRHLVLPPEPEPSLLPDLSYNTRGPEQYVLLVGEGGGGAAAGEGGAFVGRPFQVLKAKLVLSKINRRLMFQTFSSEHGAWFPITQIPTPNIHGSYMCGASPRDVMIVGDVVHWLCLTDVGSYVLMLHVRTSRVSETTALPASFPRGDAPGAWRRSYLLATDSAGGSPVVLVADDQNIRAWERCKQRTQSKMWEWEARPQVVIETEAILGFNDEVKEAVLRFKDEIFKFFGIMEAKCGLELLWFGERSGAVLLQTSHGGCFLWLDLHSKKIVRCFSPGHRRMSCTRVYCHYEDDPSSWVPTFSSAVTI